MAIPVLEFQPSRGGGANLGFQQDGTVQLFGTKGQKFLHCPGSKGQRDKLKILPRDGSGFLTFCPVPGRPAGQNHFKIWTFSEKMTRFPVLELSFPVLERPFLF